MSPRKPSSPQPGKGLNEGSLLERVRTHVLSVNRALQRRDGRAAPAGAQEHTRELRALNIVFHRLGKTHRRYREQTGEQVPVPLKAAARAFKREPSVFSLVPVAGFLDDLRLLKW